MGFCQNFNKYLKTSQFFIDAAGQTLYNQILDREMYPLVKKLTREQVLPPTVRFVTPVRVRSAGETSLKNFY